MLSGAFYLSHWSKLVDNWPINQALCPENLELGPYDSNQAKNSYKGLEWYILPCEGVEGAQRKVISGEDEAGLQTKQRSCEGRREGWRETEPAAASISVVGFSSPKLH